ncbi:MAG: DUF4097 family beta strand repeat protein [Clostridiales bacterium]|nr:DUF4097 family beta strand repeat protein [Clostridiales bacterium]
MNRNAELELTGIISGINVEADVSKVLIVKNDIDAVKINLEGSIVYDGELEPDLVTENHDGALWISVDFHGESRSITENNLVMRVEIPQEYKGDLDIEVIFGEISATELHLNKISMETISGDILIDYCNAEKFKLNTISGNVHLKMNSIDSYYEIKTISGDVIVRLIEESDFAIRFNSISGKISDKYSFDTVEVNNSHEFKASSGNGDYNMDVKTISGDLDIKID